MQLLGKITRDSLMTLEAYSKYRKENKPAIMAHRKLRSVRLGEFINLQFESETTIRYQIQEMLRIEKVFEEDGILQEIEAYAPLLPDGSNWKAIASRAFGSTLPLALSKGAAAPAARLSRFRGPCSEGRIPTVFTALIA